jgi:hypothetical protein
MNVLTVAAVFFAIALPLLVFLIIAAVYLKFRGKRIVTCPETGKPATVEVDARRAAATALLGEPSLRLKSCSRWPERKECGQECLEQIEATPVELLANWYAGKTCTLCGKPIGPISRHGPNPALMDASGTTIGWETIPPEKLPEVLATHLPVCWNCHHRQVAPPAAGQGELLAGQSAQRS